MRKRAGLLTASMANVFGALDIEPTSGALDNHVSSISTIQSFAIEDKRNQSLTIECAGMCKPTPKGCWAFVAFDTERNIVHQDFGNIRHGKGVNNDVAEYQAVLEALNWLNSGQVNYETAEILTDSLVVINHMNGSWNPNSEHLTRLSNEAYELAVMANVTSFERIPRERNQVAYALTQLEYQKAIRKCEVGEGLVSQREKEAVNEAYSTK